MTKMFKVINITNKRIAKGQSLLEVVFAIVVAALVIGGVVSLTSVAVRNSAFARNKTLATRYLQETSEWLRLQRDTDWTIFSSRSGDYCLNDLNWSSSGACTADMTGQIFRRSVTLTPAGTEVEAAISVAWEDANGNHDVSSRVRFTNWQEQ